MEKKESNYERATKVPLSMILPIILENINNKGKKKVDICGYMVNVQSLRLRTFATTGTTCPCCNTTAEFFAIERNRGSDGGYHLNLYGIDKENNDVLFTHDHIIARSLGGADDLSNTRTMCGPCNWKKGKLEALLKNGVSEEERITINEQLEKFKT